MNSVSNYIQEHKDRFLDELISLLKIPSISADSAYKNDVIKTAALCKYWKSRSSHLCFVNVLISALNSLCAKLGIVI